MTARRFIVTVEVQQGDGFFDGPPPEVGDHVESGINGPTGQTWCDWWGEVTRVVELKESV